MLFSGIAEESLIYGNILNNKRITKQHKYYMHILWKHTHFKLVQNEGLLSVCLVLMVERIGWKPSSYAPYKNPTLETLSLSILQHLCFWECKARISRCIGIFACTIYVPWFVGGWRGIFHFFFWSSSASDSKELAMEIFPWILIFLVNRVICNFARIT